MHIIIVLSPLYMTIARSERVSIQTTDAGAKHEVAKTMHKQGTKLNVY